MLALGSQALRAAPACPAAASAGLTRLQAAASSDAASSRTAAPAVDVERSLPYPCIPRIFDRRRDYSDKRSRAGRLYVVATPIGNLGDLSARARETLAQLRPDRGRGHAPHRRPAEAFRHPNAAAVAARSQRAASASPEIIARMRERQSRGAGERCRHAGHQRSRLRTGARVRRGRHRDRRRFPGPAPPIAALSIGALPTDRFCFEGFLPARGAARRARLKTLARGAAHPGVLRIAASRARDARGLRGGLRRRRARRGGARDHQAARDDLPRHRCANCSTRAAADARFRARRNRAADRGRGAGGVDGRAADGAAARWTGC